MQTSSEMVSARFGDATVTVPADVAVKAFLQSVLDEHRTIQLIAGVVPDLPPRIGELWLSQGGHYAGLVRGEPGESDYHLIDCGAEQRLTWDEAMQWAQSLESGGRRDLALPLRREQAVLFGNVPELYQKEAYWSCQQSASYSDYAWFQYFDDGFQDYGLLKAVQLLARPVRRVPFNHSVIR